MKGEALGFDLVGICRADYSPENHNHLLSWLKSGYQVDLTYLERNPRMRSDPRLFFPGAKSIISVGMSYFDTPDYDAENPYMSIYAGCRPYQDIIREKLEALLEYIKTLAPEVSGKIAVDTSPTFDRVWANRAGLGWPGKNTILINKQWGSFIFLGELFVDIDIKPDPPETDHCADCLLCIEACPTGALLEPHVLEVSRCISYLTISIEVDQERSKLIGNNLMGCDICQLVCPYNKKVKINHSNEIVSNKRVNYNLRKEELATFTESEFMYRFKGSIIAQKGFNKFWHNARAVQANLQSAGGLY
jgi:epoxyqueuosine reductase